MYSPKIREDLVIRLYFIRKSRGIPMTRLVNELIENQLNNMKGHNDVNFNDEHKQRRRTG